MSTAPSGYTMVPDSLIRDTRLTPLDFRLLVLLMSYDFADKRTKERKGRIWPAMGSLAQLLRVDRRTVFRSLLRLEKDGYLEKLRGGGGRHLSNVYKLKLCHWSHSIDSGASESVTDEQETVTNGAETVTSVSKNCDTGVTRNNSKETPKVETEKPETAGISQKGQDDAQEIWSGVLDELTFQLGGNMIARLRQVTRAARRDGAFVVEVGHPYWLDWLQGRGHGLAALGISGGGWSAVRVCRGRQF